MKTRRFFFRKLILTGLVTGSIPGLLKARSNKSEKLFLHHVFFWIKDDKDPKTREKFENALKELGSIPAIKFLHIGKPADTNREIIDTSYSYSFLAGFSDKKGHDEYQVHPVHDKFRNDYSDMWSKVLIYDSINI